MCNNFQWSNELVFKLIDLFYEKRELWDPSSEHYKDRDIKNNAWREIGKAMNTDADVINRKMRMLIGQYRRELTKTKPNSKWFAFKKLSFLRSKPSQRTRRPSGLKSHQIDETFVCSMPPRQDELDEQTVISKDRRSNYIEPSNRERKKESESRESYKIREVDNGTQVRDEFTTYGELVAMKLRKLGSSYVRSTAQYHINNILYKAEIGAYDQHSKPSSSFHSARSSVQRHDSNDDEHSQMSSIASRSMDDVLKLENEDTDE